MQGAAPDLGCKEQLEFNESFWTARQAEAERDRRSEAERQELRARAEQDETRARRALGEALAREIGDRERQRLGMGLGDGGFPSGWSPLGLRLGRFLPDPRFTWPVFAGALLLGAAMAVHGLTSRSVGQFLAGVALLLAMLIHAPG